MAGSNHVIIAQSGGPSPVINNSLRGLVDACKAFPDTFGTVYAGWHGVEGVLKEELLNLSAQPEEEIALLRTTPAAGAIGTCRYKLKEHQGEDFERIIEVFKAQGIGYFFYNGGNDSMDTAHKVSQLARDRGLDLVAVGVPKTIDNDVGDGEFKLIDHTPGYGSVARYWAGIVQNACEENRGSCPSDPVLVLQAMGRKIGFIPAAARLADPKREQSIQIYIPEAGLDIEALADKVNDQLKQRGHVVVVVSEGLDVGDIGAVKDSFGHTTFSASQMTVGQTVVNYLNEVGLNATGKARGQVPGCDQRDTAIYASSVDLDEAYKSGQMAALIAKDEGTGWMSTILRRPGFIYSVDYDKVELEKVANSERTFPAEWIAESGVDVTDDFVHYARPLIGEDWVSVPFINGVQRFARLRPLFADTKCADYVPQAYR